MFGARPTFGGSSTFGSSFGSNTPSSSTFGASTFGRPAFGTPATSSSTLFGTNTTGGSSLFGQTQSTGVGMFGANAQTTGFGNNATTSNTFGSSAGTTMFGSNNQASTGLFGSSGTAFNSTQNATRPFSFGTPASSAATGSGIFGSTSNTSGGTLFNSSLAQTTGTTIKFNPVTSSDTMNRGGVSSNIQTKIEVITAMKEYENKSLEELRVEDYLAGRKGSTTQATGGFGFGANKFGAPASTTPLFGQTSSASTNMFGSKPPENKGAFGSTTGFSFNSPASVAPFGMSQANTQVGTTFGSTGFSFGNTSTPSTGAFGDNKLAFGTTGSSVNSSFFGANKPTFGTSGGATNNTAVFGKPAGFSGGFGTSSTPTFGTANTSMATNLFTQNQAKPGFSFGTSTAGGGFGSGTSGFGTGSGIFSANTSQTKPGALTFGASFGNPPSSSGFGFNQNPSGGLLGSNTAGGFFGGQNTGLNTGSTGFGTNFNSGFGGNSLSGNQQNVNAVVNNNNLNNLIKALTHNPFGNSSLLKSASVLTGKADELLNSISSGDGGHEGNKNNIAKKPNYILPSSISLANIAKPIGINRLSNGNGKSDPTMSMLFAGLDDTTDFSSDDPFKPKLFPRVKKLGLKVFKNIKSNQSHDGSLNEVSAVASPITTPMGSPLIIASCGKGIETPTGRPLTANENTPTPDIIKGRNNIKNLNIARKMPFNDTLAEFNIPAPNKNLEMTNCQADTNKENTSISLLETSSIDHHLGALDEPSILAHPSGMKLTKVGYYTLPSVEDLKDMIDEDGKCLVENFTVGRFDYGNICFLGITDIQDLDVDSIVHIVRKEVEVYPDLMEKPTVGEGLNKPALVTLDCVWPIDKSSREVIRGEERLHEMKWAQYLENQCLKMDASFVEYRPETGSWVFKVKHFSKYGLEDNENEPASGIAKNPAEKQTIVEKPLPSANTSFVSLTSTTDAQHNVGPIITGSATKKTNGPPALGLVSPPGLNFSRPSEDLVFTPPTRKVILDDASFPMDEGIANEPDESASICPLSPSAERLTLTSKISQKAMHHKKSHLFFDDDDEFESGLLYRGEKRPLVQSFSTTVIPDNDSHSFFMGSSKKLMLASKSIGHETILEQDAILSKPDFTIHPESFANGLQPEIETFDEHEKNRPAHREARTEYPLMPCVRDTEQGGHLMPQHLHQKIDRDLSLGSNLTTCISDSAAFMGRSFRVGWGPGLTLIHSGVPLGLNILTGRDRIASSSANKQNNSVKSFLFNATTHQPKVTEVTTKESFAISIERLHLVNCNEETTNENTINPMLRNYMEIVLDHCTIKREGTLPQLVPDSGIDLLHSLAAPQNEEPNMARLATVFNLCVALWGKVQFYSPELDGCSEYAEAQCRKEALSQWLESVSSDVVCNEVERGLESRQKDGYLDAVFSHMTIRQVSEACSIAQKHDDYRLALLLSQVCLGDETPRQIMKHQLEAWAESSANKYISDFRMSLYSLIAGLPVLHVGGHAHKVNTCIGLDWKRALALHFWYFSPATSTIGEGLLLYEKASGLCESSTVKYCDEPRPPYSFESLNDSQVNYDICYHLIKLFVDPTHQLESILENSTITADPINFSGSWLIWCILSSLGFAGISETKVNLLHISFASVLESQGHWNWAAFVLMFIGEKRCREKELDALLSRQLLIESHTEDASYYEKETFLIEKLEIPIRRLQRLKAYRARFLKLNDEEAWYLLMDQDYNKAHKLILNSIAPNAVINEDHMYLRSFLYRLRSFESDIIDWTSGGAIYCAYIEILQQIDQLKATGEFSGREIEKLRPKLISLCSRLNNIRCPTAVHRVAVSEMSRVAVSVLRAILGTDPDAPRVLAQQVASLPLTHECALEELNHITNQYLSGSVMEM